MRRWPIRLQILIPFAATMAVAVTLIAVTSAYLSARRSERESLNNLRSVVATLGQSNFPYTSNVLSQMRGLSGAEFVAFDVEGNEVASTLSEPISFESLPPLVPDVESLRAYPHLELVGLPYLTAHLRAKGSAGVTSLLVLYPERQWNEARWDAAWPPLAVGAATLLAMVGVSAWLSSRVGRRVRSVQELFARIAGGSFDHAAAEPPHDELHELVLSANQLSDQLRQMQHTIGQTERMRLLAQLAGGLAHQLRNAVTGARMAIQLHQKRCASKTGDESLAVALRQLVLTEEHVKSLLSIGKQEQRAKTTGTLAQLLSEIERLVSPVCSHSRVTWTCNTPADAEFVQVDDYDNVRSALLNITLNALEAAGINGQVEVSVRLNSTRAIIDVTDNGAGPPAELHTTLFEPFVTSKPEGVGLGLALARQAAETQGGSLGWKRVGNLTVFSLELPVTIVKSGTEDVLSERGRQNFNHGAPQSTVTEEAALSGSIADRR